MYLIDPKSKEPSVSLTMAVVAFITCLFKFLLNDVQVGNLHFGTIDPTLLGALLVPTLSLYFGRKLTVSKQETTETKGE